MKKPDPLQLNLESGHPRLNLFAVGVPASIVEVKRGERRC